LLGQSNKTLFLTIKQHSFLRHAQSVIKQHSVLTMHNQIKQHNVLRHVQSNKTTRCFKTCSIK